MDIFVNDHVIVKVALLQWYCLGKYMRLEFPFNVVLQEQQAHHLTFQGGQGELLDVWVLDHDLIRVRHLPGAQSRLGRTWIIANSEGRMPREGRQRDDLSPFPLPNGTVKQINDYVEIKTAQLHITAWLGDFRLEWHDLDKRLFHADLPRLAYAYNSAGRDVFHYARRFSGEFYYGFGERAGKLSKVGMRMRMLNLDSLGYNAETTDPLYKHCPFYITFNPELNIAYGLLYDNLATSTFDMGKEIDAYRGPYRYYHAEDGDLDYYLVFGPSIAEVVEKYCKLTGRPALPPRWTLGYLGSTMLYTEADDAQEQLKQFAQLCQQHDIPCDLFHLSSGYTTNENQERCVFTWNRDRIPDPQAMVDDFHASGIRLAPNIKPFLLQSHPNYREVAERGGFIQQAETDQPQVSTFWSGGLGEMGDGAYIDFTSPAGYGWWQEKAREQLLDYGIDALWNDNNEYQIWDDEARCDGFGEAIPVGLVRPLQSLLMAHASYHAILEKQPNQRPFVLSRSGAPGIQRYAQIWSGDNTTSWNDLKYNVSMALGSSLSGMPNNGNDVGGFFGPKPEPELLVRWIQSHIFHPRFCIHSWNTDGTVTEPWMYSEVLPVIREAIHLRYRLIPYLYTLLFEAAQSGSPIMRPLVYHFPTDEQCHEQSFDFMLGSHLLVATVLEKGARKRDVYLPANAMWCNFHDGTWYAGGQTISVGVELDTIPLFVREGGLIPTGKVMAHVGAEADDLRVIHAYPHPEKGESQFSLTEDDGLSFDYQDGGYSSINIHMQSTASEIELTADIAPQTYALPYQSLEFIFPCNDTRVCSGGFDQWIDDRNRRHVSMNVSELASR